MRSKLNQDFCVLISKQSYVSILIKTGNEVLISAVNSLSTWFSLPEIYYKYQIAANFSMWT